MRFRRTPLKEYAARRIALIKPSALGDIIHSLPVLTAVRQRYPLASITWIVNRAYEGVLRGHPDLDATLAFDRGASQHGVLSAFKSYAAFWKQLRAEAFDLVIDLQGLLRSALMTAACGAPRRVGLSTAREGATWFYTDVVRVADFNAIHAVDRYWLVAEALGAGEALKQFHVPVQGMERVWALEQLHRLPKPWLALAVGSRWMTKRWPPQAFAQLARQAQDRFGGSVIFVGSSEDVPLSQATAAELKGPMLDLTGKTTLPRLSALLSLVEVMIANDTGPLHLAAALGRPVVAPYTCTSVRLNGPYGAERGAVETRVWCQGSYIKRCARLDCMRDLTPDLLWPKLQGILGEWERSCRSA